MSLALLFSLFISEVNGQYPRNFSLSNYSGVTGVAFNPANLADSRHRFALMPFSVFVEAENNFVNVETPYNQWKALRKKIPAEQLDENGIPIFYNYYIQDKLNTNAKQAYAVGEIKGPSFMLGLSNKSGIGFSTSTRMFVNLKNLNEDLLKIFLDDFDTTYAGWTPDAHQERYIGAPNNQNRFGTGALAYQEFAFSYGAVLVDDKENFLKGGVTFKLLTGLAAAYVSVDNLDYELLDVDSLRWKAADINLAYVSEDYYSSDRRLNDYFGKNKLGKGSAIDIGVVYEYRPNYRDYQYRMDRKRVEDRTANKYLLKVGASISDFGRINFNNPQYTRQRNIYSDSAVDWTHFKRVKGFNGTEDVDSFLFTLFPQSDSTNSFNAKLPASFNLMVDFQITPDWYLGSTYITSLRGNKVNGVRKQNTWSIGGRYETRKIEAGLNLVFGKFYNPIHLGMHARVGPVFIGSDNLGGIFTANSTNGINFFMGVQLPILHNRIPDMDGDMISDAKDECPNEFGSEHAKGCPDADDDRVADVDDHCPDVPGGRTTHGCPDPDGDQLVGNADKCPDKEGPPEYEGCPDEDGDGLPDHKDRCPEEFGPEENFGCPEIDIETEEVEETPLEDSTIVDENKTIEPKKIVEPSKSIEPERKKIEPENTVPKVSGNPDEVQSVHDVVNLMNFEDYDYYLILGVYESKLLADVLVRRLGREAKVLTYIYFDETNQLNYVTFGKTEGTEAAKSQLKLLDQPKVNHLINGHVWWKKVAK